MKENMKRVFAGALALVFLAGCGGNTSGLPGNTGKDAIQINDLVLKSDYVDNRIDQLFKINNMEKEGAYSSYFKAEIINGLVNSQLLSQEAEKRGITAEEDEIKALYDQSVASYGSEENFKDMLKQMDLTKEEFDVMVKEQVVYDKMVEELTKDEPVDAQAYYDENVALYQVEDQVKGAHILVETEETAKDIIAKLSEGGDFAALAKEYSTDSSNKDKGGDLGTFSAGQMVAPFSEAAFAMEAGTTSETPVQTEFGWHIIKIDEKIPSHTKPFEEVKSDIEANLKEGMAYGKIQELLSQLREEAKITYLMDEYNPELLMKKAQEEMAAAMPQEEAGLDVQAEESSDKAAEGLEEKSDSAPAGEAPQAEAKPAS